MSTKPMTRCALAIALTMWANVSFASNTVYRETVNSTVWIKAGRSTGSGVLVDSENRLVVTNFHVVGTLQEVKVHFPLFDGENIVTERDRYRDEGDEGAITGHVRVHDPHRDLAIVQLDRVPESARAITLAEKSAAPGDTVHSIGNPGMSRALWIYTSGTVRQVSVARMLLPSGFPVSARFLETQSPINPGDSGGPVVNGAGELVGVAQSRDPKSNLISRCVDIAEIRDLIAGNNRSVDKRVKAVLDAANIKYSVSAYGNYRIQYQVGSGQQVTVFVASIPSKLGTIELRRVWSNVITTDRAIPENVMAKLLAANWSSNVGAWVMSPYAERKTIEFRAQIEIDANPDSLLALINHVLNTVARVRPLIEKDILAASNKKHLLGTWVTPKSENGDRSNRIEFQITADGIGNWKEDSLTVRGKVEFVGPELQLIVNGRTTLIGRVKELGPNRLSLEVGGKTVTLVRMTAANPVG